MMKKIKDKGYFYKTRRVGNTNLFFTLPYCCLFKKI